MYNQELLKTLADRFRLLATSIDADSCEGQDLYSMVAAIMYDRDYKDCCEWKDEKPNPEGKEYRNRAKQFLLPIIVECGGIFDDTQSVEVKPISDKPDSCGRCEYKDKCDFNPDDCN